MSKTSAKAVEPQVADESAVALMGRAAMGVVENPANEPDIFAGLSQRLTQKRQVVEMAKARLENAIALEGDATAANGAKENAQGEAITILAKGAIAGLLDKPQVSAILGDAYGYKTKADGTPSKTPAGSGETLRKRVTTLSEAHSYVNGEMPEADKPKWIGDKTPEEIAPALNDWLNGGLSPWAAYKAVTEKPKKEPVSLPFDAGKLLKIAEALQNVDNAGAIADNPALVTVYDAICEAWLAARTAQGE